MSKKFIEENQLDSKIQINQQGTFDVPVNLFEETVLEPLKVDPQKYKDLMEQTNLFHAGLVQVAGDKAIDHFKSNPDVAEIGINYKHGDLWNHSTVFTRGAGEVKPSVVSTIEHTNPALHEVQQALLESFSALDD